MNVRRADGKSEQYSQRPKPQGALDRPETIFCFRNSIGVFPQHKQIPLVIIGRKRLWLDWSPVYAKPYCHVNRVQEAVLTGLVLAGYIKSGSMVY